MIRILALAALVACNPPRAEVRGLMAETPGCVLVCSEAGVPVDANLPDSPESSPDAAPDAALVAIDMAIPWPRTVITAGSATGPLQGADGVAYAPSGAIVTGYEQGNASAMAREIIAGVWVTEMTGVGSAIEAAGGGDIDGDGTEDVAYCGADRCHITFRGSPNVTVTIAATIGHGNAIQLALADLDGDRDLDLIVGARTLSATTGEFAAYANPGGAAARTSAWARAVIDIAGWPMSIIPLDVDHDGDIDLVTTDRAKLNATAATAAGYTSVWVRYGASWRERTVAGWVYHPISPPAGACPVGNPMCATKTPGDQMMATVGADGLTVYSCTSSGATTDSRIVIHRATDASWLTWTTTVLPPAPNVGHCQSVGELDPDGDGDLDLLITTWKANELPLSPADAPKWGVYWMRNDGGGAYTPGVVDVEGAKWDDFVTRGRCAISSEQLNPAGGAGVIGLCPPGASL